MKAGEKKNFSVGLLGLGVGIFSFLYGLIQPQLDWWVFFFIQIIFVMSLFCSSISLIRATQRLDLIVIPKEVQWDDYVDYYSMKSSQNSKGDPEFREPGLLLVEFRKLGIVGLELKQFKITFPSIVSVKIESTEFQQLYTNRKKIALNNKTKWIYELNEIIEYQRRVEFLVSLNKTKIGGKKSFGKDKILIEYSYRPVNNFLGVILPEIRGEETVILPLIS